MASLALPVMVSTIKKFLEGKLKYHTSIHFQPIIHPEEETIQAFKISNVITQKRPPIRTELSYDVTPYGQKKYMDALTSA